MNLTGAVHISEKEVISMNKKHLIEELTRESERLTGIIRDAEERIRSAPEGNLRIIRHGKGFQYYLITNPGDTNGVYLPVSERGKAFSLIQKSYDLRIVAAAGKQLATIQRFLRGFYPDALRDIYASASEGRKRVIVPAELPDDDYIRKWVSHEYTRKPFLEEDPEHYTRKGERVRSKSEVMIADELDQAGIPYKYECPLELDDMTIYPDFTILRTEDRKVLYWEHLGMMDDPDYCKKAIRRIRLYGNYGIFPGINLILTMETSGLPLTHSVISRMIETYCVS